MYRNRWKNLRPEQIVSNVIEAMESMRTELSHMIKDLMTARPGRTSPQIWKLRNAARAVAALPGESSPFVGYGFMRYDGRFTLSALSALLWGLVSSSPFLGPTDYSNPYSKQGTAILRMVISNFKLNFQIVTHSGHVIWDSTVNTLAQLASCDEFLYSTGLTEKELIDLNANTFTRGNYQQVADLLFKQLHLVFEDEPEDEPVKPAPVATTTTTPAERATPETPAPTTPSVTVVEITDAAAPIAETPSAEKVVAVVGADKKLGSTAEEDEDEDFWSAWGA